jgi:hypothetical protein
MDEKFPSIARRKFHEKYGAANDSEEDQTFQLAVLTAPEPFCYYFHIYLQTKQNERKMILKINFMLVYGHERQCDKEEFQWKLFKFTHAWIHALITTQCMCTH